MGILPGTKPIHPVAAIITAMDSLLTAAPSAKMRASSFLYGRDRHGFMGGHACQIVFAPDALEIAHFVAATNWPTHFRSVRINKHIIGGVFVQASRSGGCRIKAVGIARLILEVGRVSDNDPRRFQAINGYRLRFTMHDEDAPHVKRNSPGNAGTEQRMRRTFGHPVRHAGTGQRPQWPPATEPYRCEILTRGPVAVDRPGERFNRRGSGFSGRHTLSTSTPAPMRTVSRRP